MWKITLSVEAYSKATPLLFNSQGSFYPGIWVDAAADYPQYRILFDREGDASAFSNLLLLPGKILKS